MSYATRIEACKSQQFCASIVVEIDDGIKEPRFKGAHRNRITRIYSMAAAPRRVGIAGGSAPVAVVAPPAPAAVAPVPKVAAGPVTIPCPFCGEVMARSAYGAHAKLKHPDEA